MKLIEFTKWDGTVAYVNPKYVACVQQEVPQYTEIKFGAGNLCMVKVLGTPAEVRARLLGLPYLESDVVEGIRERVSGIAANREAVWQLQQAFEKQALDLSEVTPERVRQLRLARRWSCRTLAKASGLSADTIAAFERGVRNISLGSAQKIAAVFGEWRVSERPATAATETDPETAK